MRVKKTQERPTQAVPLPAVLRAGHVSVRGLPWGDVDIAGNRFRLARGRTKTCHPGSVQVPSG